MYLDYFGLNRLPFSIAPDPESLYLSPSHHEALAHLNYAFTGHGGLICLTGEVGMGKTTLCRAFIDSAPSSVDIAYIFNPVLSATELLQAICQELEITCLDAEGHLFQSNKQLFDALYQGLIGRYASGRKVICIIDEAQSMPAPLLEQIRLLTNLETNKDKLLTLILVGQPELQVTLAQYSIRQLDQRITARFHLKGMDSQQLKPYLEYRLKQAGCDKNLFSDGAINYIWKSAGGIPRLINSIADRALLGVYATSQQQVTKGIARQAVTEVLGDNAHKSLLAGSGRLLGKASAYGLVVVLLLVSVFMSLQFIPQSKNHYQILAEANGLNLDKNEFRSCQNIENNSHLGCLKLDWSLSELKRLQRPIAILDGEQWQVISAKQLQNTPISSFILWQPIQGYEAGISSAIKPGDSDELVAWVRKQLELSSLVDEEVIDWQVIVPSGQKSLGFNSYYDPILAERIARFQSLMGLKADRIIGLKTLLALQSLSAEGV